MSIPTTEQLIAEAREWDAKQELALMVQQVMVASPNMNEETAIARAKVILAAKQAVLGPKPIACRVGLPGTANVASGPLAQRGEG